jgi:hypothetical protein
MNETQTGNKTSGLEIISFFLGEQVFSVNIMSVREIRGWAPATPLAHAPSHVLGVINLRGTVIPVIDMALRLGLEAPDPLPLRPARDAVAAGHPAAPGAAFSRTRVISHSAEGRAGQAFREPPAGPLRQLAGALRLPRAGARVPDRGRPRRRHDGLQPVRLLRRGQRRALAVRLPRDLRDDLVIYRTPEPAGPRLRSSSRRPARRDARSISSSR